MPQKSKSMREITEEIKIPVEYVEKIGICCDRPLFKKIILKPDHKILFIHSNGTDNFRELTCKIEYQMGFWICDCPPYR